MNNQILSALTVHADAALAQLNDGLVLFFVRCLAFPCCKQRNEAPQAAVNHALPPSRPSGSMNQYGT